MNFATICGIVGIVFTLMCMIVAWRTLHPPRTVPHRFEKKCYLVAWLDADGRVESVSTHGEPPWSMTRSFDSELLLIYEARGESYSAAREELRAAYPLLAPRLSERLPFPGGES